MHLTTQEVPVQNLKLGMYVSRLDIPWVQTPFPLQGFYLSTQDEMDLLTHYCNKVYVDVFLSKVDVSTKFHSPLKPSKKTGHEIDAKTKRLINEKAKFKPRVETYLNNTKLNKEMKHADSMFQKISVKMSEIYRNLENNGFLDIAEVREASVALTKSVINNPNALAWLSRIHSDNKALHQQSIRSAIWALIFARHLGLSKSDLRDLGTALLLAPIGKSKLPKHLLSEQNSVEEIEAYREHVQLTLDETHKMFSVNHPVSCILTAYCERNNGSGYPKRLVGNKIPFLARVAGIADYYEQLINPHNKAETLTPSEAIAQLYQERGQSFQPEMIEKFIQAIGVYPTGSLVKLNNNSVGVVLEQPENSRLRPRISIILNKLNAPLKRPKVINLADEPSDESGLTLQISQSLKSSSDDIDAYDIHNRVFSNKRWFSFLSAR